MSDIPPKVPPTPTKYGRLYSPDPRDRYYPLRASTSVVGILRQERLWKIGGILDQGKTPTCVGHAAYQFLVSSPFMMRKGRELPGPFLIYENAKKLDEWEGEFYDGTSARGALRYLQQQGIVGSYYWATHPDEMKQFLLNDGPLMIGTEWYSNMTEPKEINQHMWLEPNGDYEGGHEWLIYGYSKKRDAYRMVNSWGTKWADRGRAWIDRQVTEQLVFGMNGDACTAIELK